MQLEQIHDKNGKNVFSLIIPVYQEEKLIETQLQRFSSEVRKKYCFELIVSDGGSIDKTVEIARKYADKIVLHGERRRQTISEGRNRGAEMAEGEVLVFLNADSYPPDREAFFKQIHAFALRHDDTVALACSVYPFPEESIHRDKFFYGFFNQYVAFLNLLGIGMGRGECQVMKRVSFRQVGGYNHLLVAGEDFDLYRRLARIGRVKYEPELLVLESPRRFRKYGYWKTMIIWTLNSLSVMIANKSISKEWEAIR